MAHSLTILRTTAVAGFSFTCRGAYYRSPAATTLLLPGCGPHSFPVIRSVTSSAASMVRFSRIRRSLGSRAMPELAESDNDLIEAIGNEIKATEEFHTNQLKEIRNGLHFEIYDNEDSDFVVMRRKYKNETIEVEAYLDDVDDDGIDEDIDDTTTTSEDEDRKDEHQEGEVDNDNDDDERDRPMLGFTVTISKYEARKLVFSCIANGEDYRIKDMYFEIKNDKVEAEDTAEEGCNFDDLTWELQQVTYKYLDRRGIHPSTLKYLFGYLLSKEKRGYLDFLNKMKQFIEK